MSCEELQEEEREVLSSIFEGDPNFKQVDLQSFQITVTSSDNCDKTIALRIYWPSQYPDVIPTFSLDLSHNNRIPPDVKAGIISRLKEFAELYLAVSMTYLIVDFLKDNIDDLIPSEVLRKEAAPKAEQLTKRQKNKLANFANSNTRGSDWVDVIRHLSQTGAQKCDAV